MLDKINKNEGVVALLGLIFAVMTFFLADRRSWAGGIFLLTVIIVVILHLLEKRKPKSFSNIQKVAKVLFVDDKECQIVTNLKRNNFDVRKIDDVQSLATDADIQWANIVFVDYKDVGKKLFGKKEGLGLIGEIKRVYGNKKRYVIYSSVQDFQGMFDFPYIRKNASYDEFISLITSEITKL